MEENGVHYKFRTESDEIVASDILDQEKYESLAKLEQRIKQCYSGIFHDHASDIEEEFDMLEGELRQVKRKLNTGTGVKDKLHHVPYTFCALEHMLVLSGRKALAPIIKKIIEKKQTSY
jgi:hypothetical protein